MRLRGEQPAFHPNAAQFTLHLGTALFGFSRQSREPEQQIFCVSNITDEPRPLNLLDLNLVEEADWEDLISGQPYPDLDRLLQLEPYQTVWISRRG
ncbi:MAG TPA: hypothetical protein DD459_08040 [Halieaceae bacterium]|nr:hypothetical protein [Halieaceae bacterium]